MVAARAGVTVRTVIRHFRSKEELFGKVAWEAAAQESARRAEAVPGDARDAVRIVVARYERIGDAVLRLLAQEDRIAAVREVAGAGRQIHYQLGRAGVFAVSANHGPSHAPSPARAAHRAH